MLRFFRIIRKKLVEEQKVRQYIYYAFGEIILVMIGILLALQINNWNSVRQERLEAIKYHERILQDLDRFIVRTEEMNENAKEIRAMIVQAVDIMESKELPASKKELFDRTMQRYYQYNYRNPELSTLREMRSSGDLDLIYNVELREDLVGLEYSVNSIDEIYLSLGDKIQSNVTLVDKYVRSRPDTLSNNVLYDIDFEGMANDEIFINIFSRFGVHWRASAMFSARLNSEAAKIREDVIKELEGLR